MLHILIYPAILIYLIYLWWNRPYHYWTNKGFPSIKSKFPYGSSKGLVRMDKYLGYCLQDLYNEMGKEGFAGFVTLRRPHLLVKDPEIIKSVLVKDFVHFTDRVNVDNIKEPLSRHIFNLGSDNWKALRVKLTPTFTSGKLKLMFPLFEKCTEDLFESLNEKLSSNKEIDLKDMMGRYTTKILGTCAYGIDIGKLSDTNNNFVKITQSIFTTYIPFKRYFVMLIQLLLPGIENYIRPRVSPVNMENFLTTLVLKTMAHRENSPVKRNDFIDLLMDIRNQREIEIDSLAKSGRVCISVTDSDLVAQVFVFLAAGFETSSSTTSYCLYELAENEDIQEKLRKEILANQPLTYQSLNEMTYLDMVISETMRKYPTLPYLTRKCTKAYEMPNGAVLEKDIRVMIPVYALHHDPQYFPNPDKFDPERFTSENKASRPQCCYLPFGEGPRLCIGMRFGLMQTKMGVASILSKYRVEKTKNTISPLEFVATPLISAVWHPIKVALKPYP